MNDRKKELVFSYEGRKFSLISSPGEGIDLQLSVSEWMNMSNFQEVKVTGQNRLTNNLILSHTSFIDSLIMQCTDPMTRDRSNTDMDYNAKRLSEMENQLQVLDDFFLSNDISDKTFINWCVAKVRYHTGYNLCLYPFFGTINRSLSDKSPYFAFIHEIMSDEVDELVYHSRLEYLKTLTTTYKIISNISDEYQSYRNQLKKDSINSFPVLFNMTQSIPENSTRELVMAFAFLNNKRVTPGYEDSLKLQVDNHLYQQVFQEEIISEPIIALIEDYDIPGKEKKELLDLYKAAEGKVIFHDFWFTSCGSCMQELPHYNDLIASAGDDVIFIFYGAYMKENEWKKTIDRYNLKGRHHLLTKNQRAFFEKYFSLSRYPHHQIVSANGQILRERVNDVSPENYNGIIDILEKSKS